VLRDGFLAVTGHTEQRVQKRYLGYDWRSRGELQQRPPSRGKTTGLRSPKVKL